MTEQTEAPASKTYRSTHNYSNFFMPNGKACVFVGFHYTTSDPEEIAELDKVANKRGSPIFVQRLKAEPDPAEKQVQEEIKKNAETALDRLRAEQQRKASGA